MPEPLFSVVRGRLDPFETAAVTVVLAALAGRRHAAGGPASGTADAAGGASRGGAWRPAPGGYQPPGSWSAPGSGSASVSRRPR